MPRFGSPLDSLSSVVYILIGIYSIGQVQEAMSTLKGLSFNVPRLPRPVSRGGADPYTTIWTFRGIMLLRMRQAGVKSLRIGSIGMDKFTTMNPDQKGHVEKLVKRHQVHIDKGTLVAQRIVNLHRFQSLPLNVQA